MHNPRIINFAIVFLLSLLACTLAVGASNDPHYVIVGAGTSGCTLAGLLCRAAPTARIVVLEQGGPRSNASEFLVRSPRNFYDSWGDESIVEPLFTDPIAMLENRTFRLVGGKTLGGTSAVNGGQLSFPPPSVFDKWGVSGLTSSVAVRLLQRVRQRLRSKFPPVARIPAYSFSWLAAARRSGVATHGSPFDGGTHDAAFIVRDVFGDNGQRLDACSAYLPRSEARCRNLQIVDSALVTKLQFRRGAQCRLSDCQRRRHQQDNDTLCVHAVEYIRNGEKTVVRARREVILAAGPYGSPKLLQMSGVGPPDVLKKAGVPVVKALPVGEHAQARTLVNVQAGYGGRLAAVNSAKVYEGAAGQEAKERFLRGEGGPWAQSQTGVLARFARAAEVLFTSGDGVSWPNFNKKLLTTICILNPDEGTRSAVEITSKDPTTPVKLRVRILDTPREITGAAACVRKSLEVFRNMDKRLGVIAPSVPNMTEYILQNAAPVMHFVGACAVNKVTDSEFKVFGIEGLRVVDASAVPDIPESAGPLTAVYIFAEHAAKLITEDGKCPIQSGGLGILHEAQCLID